MKKPVRSSLPVLLVDDDESVQQTAAIVLARAGYTVVRANDGAECLAQLRRGFSGLVLLDVMMPGLDGWATLRAMIDQKLLQENPVCMLTAVLEPGDDANGLQEYVLDYLPKPFTAPDLVAMVRNAEDYFRA